MPPARARSPPPGPRKAAAARTLLAVAALAMAAGASARCEEFLGGVIDCSYNYDVADIDVADDDGGNYCKAQLGWIADLDTAQRSRVHTLCVKPPPAHPAVLRAVCVARIANAVSPAPTPSGLLGIPLSPHVVPPNTHAHTYTHTHARARARPHVHAHTHTRPALSKRGSSAAKLPRVRRRLTDTCFEDDTLFLSECDDGHCVYENPFVHLGALKTLQVPPFAPPPSLPSRACTRTCNATACRSRVCLGRTS